LLPDLPGLLRMSAGRNHRGRTFTLPIGNLGNLNRFYYGLQWKIQYNVGENGLTCPAQTRTTMGPRFLTSFEGLSRELIEATDLLFYRAMEGRGTHPGFSYSLQVTEDNADMGAISQM